MHACCDGGEAGGSPTGAAAPEAVVAALAGDQEPLCVLELVPDLARPRKVVRGAKSAGGERTWLRVRDATGAARAQLPGDARLRVSCCGATAEFCLRNGACPGSRGPGVRKRQGLLV